MSFNVSYISNSYLPVEVIPSVAKEPFSNYTSMTKTFTDMVYGIVIFNDANTNLTFTVGADTYTVLPKERFEEYFEPFTSVSITAAGPFRGHGKAPSKQQINSTIDVIDGGTF